MKNRLIVAGFIAFLAIVSAISLYTNLTHEPARPAGALDCCVMTS